MRKLLLAITCLLGISTQALSQVTSKGDLNLTFVTGASEILRTQLEGAGSYNGEGFYGFSLSYLKPINQRFAVEAGLGYSKYNVSVTPNFYPGADRLIQNGKVDLLSIAVSLRASFLKCFFVHVGVVIDSETGSSFVDNQSDIGATAGVGFQYSYSPKLSIFVNPCLQQHAIIAFRPENYQQRLLDAGVRLGIGFQL